MNQPRGNRRTAGWLELNVSGYTVLIGRTARDNDALTFGEARPRDVWMHVAGQPGSHVVIRTPDDGDVPRDVIERAASYAVWHSKLRNARGKVDVHVCRAADVRKPRGLPAGTVHLRRYDTVKVYARDPAQDES